MDAPLTLSLLFAPEEEGDLPVIENDVPVTPVFGNQFRLEGTSAFGGGMYGDVIEVERQADGTYQFIRIVEPSGLRVHSWCIRREVIESPEFERFGEAVVNAGGVWERLMGGLIYVHLLPESTFDAEAEFQAVQATVAARISPVATTAKPWWRRWFHR